MVQPKKHKHIWYATKSMYYFRYKKIRRCSVCSKEKRISQINNFS